MTVGRWPAARRWRWGALAGLLLVATPALANAQGGGTSCEDQDREVRSLSFRGNTAFSGKELAPRVATTASDPWWKLGTRRCLDSDELRLDVGRLRVFYRRHGYYAAAVDTTVTPNGPRGADVAFVINEGEPVLIDTLRITGLDSNIAPIARTEDLGLREGAVFDITRIQGAIDSIKTRLRNQGYPKADVAASYTVDTVARRAVVDLGVLPEARAHIGAVRVFNDTTAGHPRLGDATVRRLLAVQPGDLYSARGLADAQRMLYQTDLFRSVDLRVAPESAQPKGDTLVTLDLVLRENYLRQINTEVGWAQLDCFKERTQYIDKNFLGEARRLELTVQLSKLGYGRPTRLGDGSLCAHDIKTDSVFSDKVNYFVGANLRLPTLLGFRSSPTLGIYSERRSEFQAYRRTTLVGGDASLTREVRPALPVRLGYTLEYGRTEAQPALLCGLFAACRTEERQALTDTLRRLAVASVHVDRSRTNDPVNPRFGNNLRFDVRVSARELGSDRRLEFVKGLMDASYYSGITPRLTFAARARAGTVLGRSLSFRDSIAFIPPEERLYAGGATSVRGFQQNQLGALIYVTNVTVAPTPPAGDTVYFALGPDETGIQTPIPVGGSSLVVLNLELRVRSWFFSDLLQYVLFADAGDVWNRATALEANSSSHRASSLFLNGLKWTPGIGFRLVTPVGPFQMNVGYNPYPQPKGPIYYSAQPDSRGFAPLYCVTPGNTIPAVINPQSGLYEQDPTRTCPAEFQPVQRGNVWSRLTLTFSIGPEF